MRIGTTGGQLASHSITKFGGFCHVSDNPESHLKCPAGGGVVVADVLCARWPPKQVFCENFSVRAMAKRNKQLLANPRPLQRRDDNEGGCIMVRTS